MERIANPGWSAAELSANAPKVPASAIATMSSLESRLVATKLLIGAVIGVIAGALVGALAFAALGADTTATAFLRLKAPADLTAIAGGASQITPDNQDNTATFVAGEIAYLTGDGFAEAVTRKMAEDQSVALNVAQASESSVITISYSARSDDDAVRTVQAAIDLYRQQLEQRADAQLRTILPALEGWRQADGADPVRMQELQRVRESVELQAAVAATLDVVQPPTPNAVSTQQWVIGALLGGLAGGGCAVALLLARRRRSGRGSVVKTLTEGVDGVLLPAVDLGIPARDAWTDDQLRLARTLYAQCPSPGPSRVILVVGASSSSGSAVVASLLETAAAESQPAALSSGLHSSPGSTESATTQVIAGGAVGDPAVTPEVIGAATDIVLVARIEEDTVAQTLALRSVRASSSAPVVAVFTNGRGAK
ncbi:hypothetical protein HLY00_4465 [Mycolicibacterium hippocampi]|uniref:Uncharacterized protein n=2 Tax=Mycobacteriaceae TaxID=1762 RepID=A0A850PZ33_9MYCO|nr:hypothetical protein [Mycolicibacterium hippocampi]